MSELPVVRGTSFGYVAKRGYFRSAEAQEQPELMAAMGIDWVALNITVNQLNVFGTRLFQDFEYTPSDLEVASIIKRLQDAGIRVMVKPMVEPLDGVWRGRIKFPEAQCMIEGLQTEYWQPWFESLTRSAVHYAQLCEDLGCDLYCLGCELDGTESQHGHWQKLIDTVREVYTGRLTYDTTLPALKAGAPPWFGELDCLQVSFYPRMTDRSLRAAPDQGPEEVDALVAYVKPRVDEMAGLAERFGKPLLFGECGCRSRRGALAAPADWQQPGIYDGVEQARFYDAVLTSLWDQPWWGGMFFWKWEEQQYRAHYHTDPAGDMGFAVQGKPAAEVVRQWYTRPDRR